MFMELDADKDGAVSKQEASAQPALVEQWKELDANVDGQLDEAEFAAFTVEPEAAAPAPEK
jgi:hypothetical protein